MSEVLEANIFFFIASVGVIAFTLLSCIGLYYVIKILRSVQRIIERIEKGSGMIAEDVAHLREYLGRGSFISRIVGMFFSQMGRRNSRANDED